MDFLYAADNGFFNLLRISMISCVKYNKGAMFHVFTMDSPETKQIQLSNSNKKRLKAEIEELDSTAKIIFYDVRDLFLEKMGNSINNASEYTPYAALRLLAPFVLNIDFALYLDCDTLVATPLTELFVNYKNKQFDIAATAFINENNNTYFLSSVILFNLKYQRENNFKFINEAINIYNTYKLKFPDQDAITMARKTAIILEGSYYMNDYQEEETKILCVCNRFSMKVRNFLKHSVYPLKANQIYDNLQRIQMLISEFQKDDLANL